MSGRDERKLVDIPACSRCGKIPDYWVLYDIGEIVYPIAWLLGNNYLKSRGHKDERIIVDVRRPPITFSQLVEILVKVRCSEHLHHTFARGGPVFNEVVASLKKYHTKEGY